MKVVHYFIFYLHKIILVQRKTYKGEGVKPPEQIDQNLMKHKKKILKNMCLLCFLAFYLKLVEIWL